MKLQSTYIEIVLLSFFCWTYQSLYKCFEPSTLCETFITITFFQSFIRVYILWHHHNIISISPKGKYVHKHVYKSIKNIFSVSANCLVTRSIDIVAPWWKTYTLLLLFNIWWWSTKDVTGNESFSNIQLKGDAQ